MARIIKAKKFKIGMVLIAIGVVYGDIATSPMYVMKSIIAGNGGLSTCDKDFIIGSLSLIIWTLTLITTVKYMLITMKADNNGEGGVFALYSLVKKYYKWLVIPAMIGGATLMADSMLTPAVTVTTAVEGLRSIEFFNSFFGEDQLEIILIVVFILSCLFAVQRAGTSIIGKLFGPFMTVWFLFLAIAGICSMSSNLEVLRAINPIYAIQVLFSPNNAASFMILGSVFLATTGAEALYCDMGHVGKKSIYISWPLVKVCLILNYFGQGAWIINNSGNSSLQNANDLNPFYLMIPENFKFIAILLGAMAAIIASQALITGSFSVVSEAIRLNLMPHLQIFYPSETKGQLYINSINRILWIGCIAIVIMFQTSANMESAYGLSITISNIMISILLVVYIAKIKNSVFLAVLYSIPFGILEFIFFLSCIGKFFHGGWVAILIAVLIYYVMDSWRRGTNVEAKQRVTLHLKDYIPQLEALKNDMTVPKIADNLVYLTHSNRSDSIERDVLFSILDNEPKRANAYWFVNFITTQKPFGKTYRVETFGTKFLFRVVIKLGFKEHTRLNTYLNQIIRDLVSNGEYRCVLPNYTIFNTKDVTKYIKTLSTTVGNFKYCFVRKTISPDSDLPQMDKVAVTSKYKIRHLAGGSDRWYGLETSRVLNEYFPLFIKRKVDKNPIAREEVIHSYKDKIKKDKKIKHAK